MKPSAWVIRDSQGTIEPVYTAAEIRKWLMEEPSFEVIHAAVESYDSSDGSMVEYCRGLFAAKLEELK
jgi:hypothetical protein